MKEPRQGPTTARKIHLLRENSLKTTLASLIEDRPATLVARLGETKADEITAYLRRNPGAVVQQTSAPLVLARVRPR